MAVYETENCIIGIDISWSEGLWYWVRGWVVGKDSAVHEINLTMPQAEIHEFSWHSRKDIASSLKQYSPPENCGFTACFKKNQPERFQLQLKSDRGNYIWQVPYSLDKPNHRDELQPREGEQNLFDQFVKIVNDNHLDVLEIGSRIVSPGSQSQRIHFQQAKSYTGFDYYKDENTDVVGDAHRLASYFGERKFDAIFSGSVFEHLAMPWRVALEINRLLKPGGITFHATHPAWPIHEMPWDFWRFSSEGMKALFSEAVGFRVLSCSMTSPVRMYMENPLECLDLPLHRGYAGVAILAQKIRDFDENVFCWNAPLTDVVGESSHYPEPQKNQSTNQSQATSHKPVIF